MKKDEVEKLEKKLENFYKKDRIIISYEREIERLIKDIENIDRRIKECDFTIPVTYGSSSFSERVQSSNSGESNAEKELMKLILRLENKKIEKNKEIEGIRDIINSIEEDSFKIRRNLYSLKLDYINLIELKYKYGKSNRAIAIETHMSESTISRKIRTILKEVKSWQLTFMYKNTINEIYSVKNI